MKNPSESIDEAFSEPLNPIWQVTEVGTGKVIRREKGLSLTVTPIGGGYSNAQIADYPYPPKNFRWRPPLRMTVTAWASGSADTLLGTAGFGFWNHPFSPDIKRLPRLPRAIWFFFGSPPNDMRLALDVPGNGWKAATIDATRARSFALIPTALPLIWLMRRPSLYRSLWGRIQRMIGVSERALSDDLLRERHTYEIEWRLDGATFSVDGEVVHTSPDAPHGDAGFVAWIDNQYAVATPQGDLRFGLLPIEREQSLILERVKIERL